MAVECGDDVLIADSLTEWSTSYVQPNGSTVVEMTAGAVRQDGDGDGAWAPVDVQVLAAPVREGEDEGVPGGMLPVSGGVEPMWLNPGGVTGSGLPLAIIGPAESRVSMYSRSLPVTATAQVTDGRVSYDLGRGVALSVSVNDDGTIVTPVVRMQDAAALEYLTTELLEPAPGQDEGLELLFPLETSSGLSVEPSDAGFEVRDGAGEVAFESGPVVMWDSSGAVDWDDVGTGEGASTQESSTGADVEVFDALVGAEQAAGVTASDEVPDREGAPATGDRVELLDVSVQDDVVTVSPDPAVLDDPELEFPIYLDPSIGASAPTRWGTIRSGWPTGSIWKNGDDQGLGFCDVSWVSSCDKDNKQRLLWRFSSLRYGSSGVRLGNLDSSDIKSADFSVYGTHSWGCTARGVKVYGIDDVDNTVTWNNQPDWMGLQETRTVSHKAACDNKRRIVWDVTSRTKTSASRDQSWVALGMKAGSESSMEYWKRYNADTAKLTIVFNRAPDKPSSSTMKTQDTMACATSSSSPLHIRDLTPKMQAKGTDPDGQKVQMEFKMVRSGGSEVYNSAWTTAQASGETHSKTVASSKLQSEKLYWWTAQARDNEKKESGWSGARCYVRPDTTPPVTPTATSAMYPQDDLGGGANQSGTFTLDDAGSNDVAKFNYSFDSDALNYSVPASSGKASITFSTQRTGSHVLYVQSEDEAGNRSNNTLTYRFSVDQSSATGWWTFDEATGTVAQDSAQLEDPTQGALHPLTVSSAKQWRVPGWDGWRGSALDFDGQSEWAHSDGPVLNTAGSFTVTAVVNLDAVDNGHQMAVSQAGQIGSAFKLGYLAPGSTCPAAAEDGCWSFLMYGHDGSGNTRATSDISVNPNEPVRLTGVYDRGVGEMRLYVCSTATSWAPQLADTTAFSPTGSGWTAGGDLEVGRARVDGSPSQYWEGLIDDVRVYDRAIDNTPDNEVLLRVCQGGIAGG